jgi:hypothetical protein
MSNSGKSANAILLNAPNPGIGAIRIADPNHPLHNIRQKMIELKRRCPQAGMLFRMVLASGHPVVCRVLGWSSVAGYETSLEYEVLATKEKGEFSWREPGSCVDIQFVDSSEEGLDFAGIAHKAAKAAAMVAKRERAAHKRTAEMLQVVLEKLQKEMGAKKTRQFLRSQGIPEQQQPANNNNKRTA